MYVSCWLHGDVRQYEIATNPACPRLVGHLRVGGAIRADYGVRQASVAGAAVEQLHEGNDAVLHPQHIEPKLQPQPQQPLLEGGPQMMQLSLDGRRLYVTNSLLTSWDDGLYPAVSRRSGSWMIVINVDTDKARTHDHNGVCFGCITCSRLRVQGVAVVYSV